MAINDGFEIEGTISSRPTVLNDFIKLNKQIWDAYRYLDDKDEEVKELFAPILGAACDQACDIAYSLGFEDPNEICENEYTVCTCHPDGTTKRGYGFPW